MRARAQSAPAKALVDPANEDDSAKRARRSGDKRERILNAAVRVFAKNGFYATRVSEVAKAAGVADGTIYLYFRSKDELLVSLFEDRVERLLAYMKHELPLRKDSREKQIGRAHV